jgi:hypothetical protein
VFFWPLEACSLQGFTGWIIGATCHSTDDSWKSWGCWTLVVTLNQSHNYGKSVACTTVFFEDGLSQSGITVWHIDFRLLDLFLLFTTHLFIDK